MRFPRDWVGPLDELLPIGPLPRRSAASSPPDDAALPPSADAFWSEDSAALHDAVTSQGGPAIAGHVGEAPATTSTVLGERPRGLLPRARLTAAAGLLVVVALMGLAVIGYANSGADRRATHPGTNAAAASHGAVTDAALRPVIKPPVRAKPARHHIVRARARPRHHARHTHRATPSSATAAATTTSTVSSTPTPSGTSAVGNSESGAAGGSRPTTVDNHPVSTPPPASTAFGQKGTLGPGSSSDS